MCVEAESNSGFNWVIVNDDIWRWRCKNVGTKQPVTITNPKQSKHASGETKKSILSTIRFSYRSFQCFVLCSLNDIMQLKSKMGKYLLPRRIGRHLRLTIASNGNYGMDFSNETYAWLLRTMIDSATVMSHLAEGLMVGTTTLLAQLRFFLGVKTFIQV